MYKYITRDYDANNQDQIVLPGGNYQGIGLALEGTNLAGPTIAAAIEVFLDIPFHWNPDNNIVRLGSGYVLEYQHNTLSAITATLNLTLMLQRGLGIQRYMPRYNDFNIRSLSAETTPDEFARKNLAMVAIVPTANISVIKLEKDNNLIT